MCKKAVEDDPGTLNFVPDHLKTQQICEKAVEDDPDIVEFEEDPWSLLHVPDWFVMQEQVKLLQ